ncbi:MAG: protein kinase domain-containing protein [Limnobacter sp.]|uniref:protein kinase domain-containing protein n=1 Tax=Limnobacter sp. TaxID=2003368 RepID=UPI00391A3E00
MVEILSELNSEELSRFYSRHPFFKNLIYPVDVNFNQTRNEFGQLKYVAKTLFYGGRNGVLQLGRLINSDTYVVVKEGYHRVHVWRVPYPQSSVVNQVLNKNFRTIAYLHAIAMRMNNWRRNPLYTEGNKSPVVTVTELGLSNLDPIIDGLNIVKWVFAAGRGALDSRRLQFIKRLADERYRVFDDNEDVSINMRPKVKSFLEEIQGFSNPVTLYRYMNELGRLVFSCATSLQQINVVHQDIKPGNIIVVNNEGFTELKLIDIDHMVHKNDCAYRYKESNVHASGYIDPQVLRFENNFESRLSNDIYATGITLRQLSGQSLSNIYRRGSQPEVNMFHLDEIGKSSDWYPLDYPSMEKVLSRAKGDAPITHLYYVGLLLSSKLATNSSGKVVQSRMEGVRFVVDNSGYFTQGRGMDDPELLDMTLALLKTSCAMNKDLRYQMYNSAAREYGISVNERSFSQYLFNMEKSRVKKLGLESLNRHQIRAIEAPLAWPVDRMLGSESLVSGSSSELRCSSGSSVGTYA